MAKLFLLLQMKFGPHCFCLRLVECCDKTVELCGLIFNQRQQSTNSGVVVFAIVELDYYVVRISSQTQITLSLCSLVVIRLQCKRENQ